MIAIGAPAPSARQAQPPGRGRPRRLPSFSDVAETRPGERRSKTSSPLNPMPSLVLTRSSSAKSEAREELRVSKKSLRVEQSDAALVERAALWAQAIVQRESRGPGDLDNAMRRLEVRYGVPFQALWALRYRKPKALIASIYLRLQAAYEAECARQMRQLKHELETTRRKAGAFDPAVAAAAAVVGEDETDDT